MTVYEMTRRSVHDHGRDEPDLIEERDKGLTLTPRMRAKVSRVREKLLGIFGPDAHDPILK
jgi:hypothetical protein